MIRKKLLLSIAILGTLLGLNSVLMGLVTKQRLAVAQKSVKNTGVVLAATTGVGQGDGLPTVESDVHFEVNIPAIFNDTVTINGELVAGTFTVDELLAQSLVVDAVEAENITIGGELTAPNVVYSVAGTDGLSVSGDQDLTISNTDKGSSQNIFKKLKVGDNEASAGSNSDTFTFVAGTNISLSLNTSDKKLTITNSYSIPAQAWTESGTNVYLTTSTNSVGIGTESPSSKLHVVGSTLLGGNTTLGGATTNTITMTGRLASGTSILPIVDLGADLGSSSLRFNNIYVATINTNSTLSTAGQAIFTYEPTSTIYTQSSVLVNPTAPPANSFLLGLGQGGLQRAGIDAEGDLTLGYSSGVSAPNSAYPLSIYGHNATQIASVDTSGNAVFNGSVTASSFVGSVAGSINPGFTLGSVAFQGASGLAQDNANFFWDDTNNRLGIGTTVPLATSDVRGNSGTTPVASISGQTSFAAMVVDNRGLGDIFTASSSGLNRFVITQAGNVGIGTTTPTATLHIASGQLRAADGTAAAPGITFQDANTGWLWGGTGNWAWAYGSARKFRLAGGGDAVILASNYRFGWHGDADVEANTYDVSLYRNATDVLRTDNTLIVDDAVGIGTTSLLATLDVRGNSGTLPVASVSGQTAFAAMVVDNRGLGDIFTASSSGLNRFVVKQSGNVGIGTTTPTSALEVVGSAAITSILSRNGAGGGLAGAYIRFVDGGNASQPAYTFGNNNTNGMYLATTNTLGFSTNSTERLRIDATGNFGLNTTSPLATLDVRGTSGTTPVASISGQTSFAAMVVDNRGLGDIFTASSSGLNRFVITQAGNVGIGQTSPDTKLHVGSTSVTDGTNLLKLQDANSACTYTADNGTASCASDLTLKTNISSLDTVSLLDRVSSLRPVSYHWKTEDVNAPLQHGFIAQEVAELFPELVKDGTWADGTTRKFLNMGGLMPYVIGAVKEQQLQINQLALATDTELSTDNLTATDLHSIAETQTNHQAQLDEQKSMIAQLQSKIGSLFENAATFLADVTFKGRLFFNPNQTGTIAIPAGATTAKITFSHALPQVPVVNATPHEMLKGQLIIKEITQQGFLLEVTESQESELSISWLATLVDQDAQEQPTVEILPLPSPSPSPTEAPTPSPSPSPIVVEPIATESASL